MPDVFRTLMQSFQMTDSACHSIPRNNVRSDQLGHMANLRYPANPRVHQRGVSPLRPYE